MEDYFDEGEFMDDYQFEDGFEEDLEMEESAENELESENEPTKDNSCEDEFTIKDAAIISGAFSIGYEVGFYRVIYQEEGKENRKSYGRFHVVLKKIDGQWKIAQDWDSNSFNGRPIGQQDFDEGKKLDLIN